MKRRERARQEIQSFLEQQAEKLIQELEAHVAQEKEKLDREFDRQLHMPGRSAAWQADIEAQTEQLRQQAHENLDRIKNNGIRRIRESLQK